MGLGVSQSSLPARLRTTMLRMPSSTLTLVRALCIWWLAWTSNGRPHSPEKLAQVGTSRPSRGERRNICSYCLHDLLVFRGIAVPVVNGTDLCGSECGSSHTGRNLRR
jgi:hypothetical protein